MFASVSKSVRSGIGKDSKKPYRVLEIDVIEKSGVSSVGIFNDDIPTPCEPGVYRVLVESRGVSKPPRVKLGERISSLLLVDVLAALDKKK